MQTLDALQKRIGSTGELLGVVRTMKSLAAVNIRHFEQAAHSLLEYAEVVELGWTVLFRSGEFALQTGNDDRAVVLVVGADQGMCGQFNEIVLRAGLSLGEQLDEEGLGVAYWSASDRVKDGLIDLGLTVNEHVSIPGTLGGVGEIVSDLVDRMAHWNQKGGGRFYVVHNAQAESGRYAPVKHHVLPLDRKWSERFAKASWPRRNLPKVMLPGDVLFSRLFNQHLFVSLYGALVQSMAAENAARLAAMQAAEKNIVEMRETLQGDFRQARQAAITSELLDIVAGVEAL